MKKFLTLLFAAFVGVSGAVPVMGSVPLMGTAVAAAQASRAWATLLPRALLGCRFQARW